LIEQDSGKTATNWYIHHLEAELIGEHVELMRALIAIYLRRVNGFED
jgi:hypothetical protein